MQTKWLLGTVCLGVACSSGGSGPTQSERPAGDEFGVRVAGGEASDFGNGTDDLCGTSSVATVITTEQAEQLGLDVEADRAWLALPRVATLRWSPIECEVAPELCEPTEVELKARVVEPLLIEGKSFRVDEFCLAEWQAFAYRLAVSIESEDGNIAGTFYAQVGRSESESGVVRVVGRALPHLWNFVGGLPLEFDLGRSHYAYLSISFSLTSDGSAGGKLEPKVSYYDAPPTDGSGGAAGASGDDSDSWQYQSPRIGAEAFFGSDLSEEPQFDGSSVLALEGERSTLTTYPGSALEPHVDLRVRADAVEPAADVDVMIWVDGEQVYDQSVAAGTSIGLGEHPLGTPVVVDVHNGNDAGQVRAHVNQGNCWGASASCTGEDCTAHLEYTTAHRLCIQ